MEQLGLNFLLPYMRPYRRDLLLGTLFAFLGAGAQAFSPTVLGYAVDNLKFGIQPSTLALYGLALVLLSAILAFFRYKLRMLTGYIAAGVTYRMSADLFHRLLLFDKETREKYGTGDLLSRATSDFIYIWRFYSAGFQMSMHALFLLLIGCTLIALTSPALAALVMTMLIASVIIQIRLGRRMEKTFKNVQEQMASISAFVEEHLGAARMLRAYAQEKEVGQAFAAANQGYVRDNLRFVLQSGLISPLPRFVVQLASAIVVLVGGLFIIDQQLTLGQYVQFLVYLTLLNGAAQMITGSFERIQQGSAAAARIGEVLHKWPAIVDTKESVHARLQGNIRFENAGVYAADQKRWILRNINLDIPAGQTVGIVGATGAGKSMLLGLLGRIHDPSEGSVQIDGYDLQNLKLATLRQNIVYVPQETLLFSMKLRDNIAFGVPETPEPKINHAIKQSRLVNDLPQLPQGLDSLVGERGATLSGGQKQRTAIARAVVREPTVLLLDDALASVDMKTSAEIINELSNSNPSSTEMSSTETSSAETARAKPNRTKRTSIIVSQRMAAVQNADQIVVLDHGSIIAQGTHNQLLQQGGLYADMFHREIEQAAEDTPSNQANHRNRSAKNKVAKKQQSADQSDSDRTAHNNPHSSQERGRAYPCADKG